MFKTLFVVNLCLHRNYLFLNSLCLNIVHLSCCNYFIFFYFSSCLFLFLFFIFAFLSGLLWRPILEAQELFLSPFCRPKKPTSVSFSWPKTGQNSVSPWSAPFQAASAPAGSPPHVPSRPISPSRGPAASSLFTCMAGLFLFMKGTSTSQTMQSHHRQTHGPASRLLDKAPSRCCHPWKQTSSPANDSGL